MLKMTASLAVLSILHGGHITGAAEPLPLDRWLRLTIVWSSERYSFDITAGPAAVPRWTGSLIVLKRQLAMPPSYLRVRSLGSGSVCLRSANMTKVLGYMSPVM